MFQKLFLAITITLSLYLFWGGRLNTNSPSATKALLANMPTISDLRQQ